MIPLNSPSPGVYINEFNSTATPIVSVPTSIPAFIGYTPQAVFDNKSLINVPQKISSFKDFETFFCFSTTLKEKTKAKNYNPNYYLLEQKDRTINNPQLEINGTNYAILPDPNSIYYLYNSIRLFYENGGCDAYIVSVGNYGKLSGTPLQPSDPLINPNVRLPDLLGGLAQLKNVAEVSMYLCPDATLLSVANNATLMQTMLRQNEEMKTAISIFDIIGGDAPHPIEYVDDIETFRNNTGSKGLSFGAAYYPFVETTLLQNTDIDYTNVFGGDVIQLGKLLNQGATPKENVSEILSKVSTQRTAQIHKALELASPTYKRIMKKIGRMANTIPVSGGIAGVITRTDNAYGTWHAPANIAMTSIADLTIRLTDIQQGHLNTEPISGISINAIRFFPGHGYLIWGARTMDGNNLDTRYLPVKRTIMFLEQTVKLTLRSFVFEGNNQNTWTAVTLLIANYLSDLWKRGGLQGATEGAAYNVSCGLGTTMTANDIAAGRMIVLIRVAIMHPSEFINFSITQEMAKSA